MAAKLYSTDMSSICTRMKMVKLQFIREIIANIRHLHMSMYIFIKRNAHNYTESKHKHGVCVIPSYSMYEWVTWARVTMASSRKSSCLTSWPGVCLLHSDHRCPSKSLGRRLRSKMGYSMDVSI